MAETAGFNKLVPGFDFLQGLNIPWVENNRLFADSFCMMTQCKPDM